MNSLSRYAFGFRAAGALLLLTLLGACAAVQGADIFTTPVASGDLDAATFSQWSAGVETPMNVKKGPQHVVWTQNSEPEWDGVKFGESKTPGVRHLRIGFKKAQPAGTVVARAGGQLSVLKPTAAFPGNLGDEADWIPAQRLEGESVSRAAAGREDFAVWVLPPGTSTRALRFTHTAEASDKSYEGWLGGVFVLADRFANLAPQGIAMASARNEVATKLNNENNDGIWQAWDNGKEGNTEAISPTRPEWLLLMWPKEVKLAGLNALWAGFSACEVQAFDGPADRHPREAQDSEWKTVKSFAGLKNQYPRALGANWLPFDDTISTRAVRVKITQVTSEGHSHLRNHIRGGKRVWLGELMALTPLGNATLESALLPAPALAQPHPPIAIPFTLPEPGFVTLVIDDESGKRVRNLISETPFPAGQNTAWWDGLDDLQRDPEAARHGIYRIPERFVEPGRYRVRGLWRKQVDLKYEFSIYNAGSPAWETADSTGAWLANHTPPCGTLFVPEDRAPGGKPLIYLGSFVSEGGHGLAWVDLDGRKQGGVGWVGGTWTGGPFLARDDGPQRDTKAALYVAAPWSIETYADRAKNKRGEIRLSAVLSGGGTKPVLKHIFTPSFAGNTNQTGDKDWFGEFGGLAARDGVLAFTLPKIHQVLFVDTRRTNVVSKAEVKNPHGLAFDDQGRLLVLSEGRLLRFQVTLPKGDDSTTTGSPLSAPEVVITSGLDSPRAIALSRSGEIFITDQGESHQVKVFSAKGEFLRAIGKPGTPKAGTYDPQHMNHPDGLTLDSQGRLWVAENDYQPKRVSVWTSEGQFVRAFYGPSEYGGGGRLDPEDKTKFYFHGMEFHLDWEKGADQLTRVFYRPAPGELGAADGYGASAPPEMPHYWKGKRYFSNDHNNNPTGGAGLTMLWQDVDGIARPVAAFGRASDWKIFKGDKFKPLWPAGVDLQDGRSRNSALVAWSDLNSDGQIQTNEVVFEKSSVGSITVAPDLSFVASRIGSNAVRFPPVRFTEQGVPVYDLSRREVLASSVQGPTSSGGDQALWNENGWTILTTPPKPFAPQSIGGVFRGETRWAYPSLWPGLHASHESPPPAFPGMVLGTTRLLGDFVTPRSGDAGPLWCINGNQGNMYLLTADGLFVAELFKDVRLGKTWSMPVAQRGMSLNALTLHDENFWPSITQTKDGSVYLCDGGRSSLVRVDGLETIRRLPDTTLTLSTGDLQAARAHFVEAEARRQQAQGRGVLQVLLRSKAPTVDGKLDDWAGASWVDVDKSGTAAYFNSDSKPHDVTAAVCIAGDRLFAAWRADDATLLKNSGDQPQAPFKTGGALDLMLSTQPASAENKRTRAGQGDLRLLVTQVKGKTFAVLYRPVVPGTKDPVAFSSPWRTITLDKVEDISAQVELSSVIGKDDKGKVQKVTYELSVPLSVLGLKPAGGLVLRGDIGILRGNGFQTTQRVYWANKATGITADVPSEAELTPQLWGRWELVQKDK